MKAKNLIIGGISTLALLVAGTAVANAAVNDSTSTVGNVFQNTKAKVQEFRQNRQENMKKIQDMTYTDWKAMVDEREQKVEDWYKNRVVMTDYITADNYAKFVEMHKLMQAGDTDGANAIRQELGLPERPNGNPGMMMGRGQKVGHFMGRASFGQNNTASSAQNN